ncbi:TIGR02270 family protein [Nitrosomonas sp. Nm84]|uniref:TIGR02270 family protein n=1 Tax=Nitrosomonas sp. Nm84 TaxID=200124 RepID=UPI001A9D3223|nr:TIGR02270 family protein [Nitrosomonas sp. Nm84]
MQIATAKPIPHIIQQHAEESAILHNIRLLQVVSPHIKLHHLRRIDDRIAAHLDGLAVAGEYGSKICEAALESAGIGEVFVATIRAIEEKDEQWLDRLFALAAAVPEVQPGLISAFGWISAQHLQGIGASLLASSDPFKQQVGLAACVSHRVDAGVVLTSLINHQQPQQLRARALRAAGELGRRDLRFACEQSLTDKDVTCRFWAAWSATLLGNRTSAVEVLKAYSLTINSLQEHALQLVLKVLALTDIHALLKTLAQNASNMRCLIRGAGIAGDPYYVPWLIKQMDEPKFSRLGGESFSFITGLDLAYLDLERDAPEGIELGPNDDPESNNVQMDEDDNLPWPDPTKIQAWWDANKSSFANGERYFMGKLISRDHSMQILKEGFQRQRIAANQHLCLLESGTQLFPVSAPAWRQQRWLNT